MRRANPPVPNRAAAAPALAPLPVYGREQDRETPECLPRAVPAVRCAPQSEQLGGPCESPSAAPGKERAADTAQRGRRAAAVTSPLRAAHRAPPAEPAPGSARGRGAGARPHPCQRRAAGPARGLTSRSRVPRRRAAAAAPSRRDRSGGAQRFRIRGRRHGPPGREEPQQLPPGRGCGERSGRAAGPDEEVM